MTAASSAVATPMKQSRQRGHSPSAHDASSNTLRNEDSTPISHDPRELLKRRKAFAARQQRAKVTSSSQPSPALQIPDTVVWENNIPKGWFYFDSKELHVARRKVETKQIQEAFLKDALFENDIVAVVYSVSHNHHNPLQPASPPHGGSGGGGARGGGSSGPFGAGLPDDGTEALQYRYLTTSRIDEERARASFKSSCTPSIFSTTTASRWCGLLLSRKSTGDRISTTFLTRGSIPMSAVEHSSAART
ncbi:Hypothetical protein, putative [Bodo saltans]|uniref:Uncharacterized protein n=1 Tax=Bodo saltans TaxID=75058 RepID=A0A0S4KJT3_BODSA|nr:Hypothetical protein, putative [Bodo saltans]|eukprot:CUI14553.1 Hypothetical protein, putative [Bodo saltans]